MNGVIAMDSTEYIWMDGTFVKWEDARIHVLTHTLHYGMGVFEGIRFYETARGPSIFRLDDHINRFFEGAETACMRIPFSKQEIKEAIIETVRINKLSSGYIRPIAYLGYGKMGLKPKGAPTNVSIATWPWGSYLGEDTVKVKISKFMRIHSSSTVVEAKICGHYVNSIFASCDAEDNDCDEALLLDQDGNIGEGPGENFFMIKDGVLYTPEAGKILTGITRDSIMKVASDMGIRTIERPIRPEEVLEADEAFFTGSAAEVTPIASVDGKMIGTSQPGPLSSRFRDLYLDIVQGREEKYKHWLTFVE